jgi:cytidylate kinase
MIVTIDGPAGAGKSTVARGLARRLGYQYLDTGAMYRAVALAGLRAGVDWDRPDELVRLAKEVTIDLRGDRVLLDGQDVSQAIRSAEVTAMTRFAAGCPEIREHLVQLQRKAAGTNDVVTEGRDQGTVVFPHAHCKVFLTASAEERARRRIQDFNAAGEPNSMEAVLEDINRRDHQDASRPVGPLVAAADAVLVSTDGLTVEQVIQRLESLVRRVPRGGP